MSQDTNRLAQLIATATNKELGTRTHTKGEPLRQDKAAAEAIAAEYVFIPRNELPEAKVIERDGGTHVDCGSDWGTWKIQNVDRMRSVAFDYVAAWVTAEAWREETWRKLAMRRDELAAGLTAGTFLSGEHKAVQRAIDRIIELQDAVDSINSPVR